jgi:transcriptional regulator with XRE-family HTH domain
VARTIKSEEQRRMDERIGRRIEAVRKATGKKASVLAREVELSPKTLCGYEAGRSSVPTSVLLKIAKALEISLHVLMQ